jgi:hypothetical protein
MNSDLYQADKARLIRMVEDVTPDCTQAADAQFHPKPVAAA